MSDPSFDDLLESLDAIQAEHSHQRRDSSSSSSSSSSDSDNEGKKKRGGGHLVDDDDDHHRASIQLNFELPPPPPPVQEDHHHHHHHHQDHQDHHQDRQSSYSAYAPPPPSHHNDYSHQAIHDHAPAPTFSAPVHQTNHAATPSRSGDVKQYQRQSIIQPKQAHHGSDTHCAKCNNSLYGTEYVTAGGRSYHQEHFTCAKCSKKLIGAYYDHHSQVYCPSCAGELMPCTKCHRGITGQYMILEGKPYHNECVERKHCAQCHGSIEDTVLTALGKTWHTRCFKCIQCSRELGREFINKDGHGQCVSCAERARPNCEKCHGPLSGEFINFQGQQYHQDCFVCAQCRTRLGTSGFFNVHGQLKCQRCAK